MAGGQSLTKAVYEDAAVVRAFEAAHVQAPLVMDILETFAAALPGKRVIDIGCGPGRDARRFAALGFQVTAVDYSRAMIEAALRAPPPDNPPHFSVLDMRAVGDAFAKDSFDGAWICASLIHVPESEVPAVLEGVHKIVAPGGRVHLSMKEGPQGAALVREHKYGREIAREFIFWQRANFERVLHAHGFRVMRVESSVGGGTGGAPTSWLRFHAEVVK